MGLHIHAPAYLESSVTDTSTNQGQLANQRTPHIAKKYFPYLNRANITSVLLPDPPFH